MRLSRSFWRVVITNTAPPFTGSALLLYIAELKGTRLLSLEAVAYIMSAVSLATFLGPLLAGLLGRHLRSLALMWLGLGLFVSALSVLAFTLQPLPLMACFFALGLGYGLVLAVTSAELSERMPEETHVAIAIQMAAAAVGGMAAPQVAMAALARWPVTSSAHPALPLVAPALGLSLLCLLPALLCRDYQVRPSPGRAMPPWHAGILWWLVALVALHGACDLGSWGWMPIWMQDRGGAVARQIAAMISLTWLGSLLGRGLTILLARRFGSAAALRISVVGAALGILLTYQSRSPHAMIASYSLYCLLAGGNLPGLVALAGRRLPAWRTEMMGLLMGVMNGSGSLATFVIAQLAVRTGDSSTGLPVPVFAMALLAVIVLLHRRLWPAQQA